MKRKNRLALAAIILLLPVLLFTVGCPGNKNNGNVSNVDSTKTVPEVIVKVPAFSADMAYDYTKAQVDFGPRIPGTKAHKECLDFIVAELEKDSLHPTIQKTKARTFDGKYYEIDNVIAQSQPKNNVRIMLCTHWDTRPWADADSSESTKPFDGACDGASGVGMMLEVAHHLKDANIGVDLVFFDLEDYGQQNGVNDEDTKYPPQDDTWCLGSQYWAKNLPNDYIMPRFGILLDMIGGKNAAFPTEGTSMQFAPQIVNKVWGIAAQLGYGNYFTHDRTTPTIDDHLYVNKLANIPTIDIVAYDVKTRDYPYYHHKHSDNMSVIDKTTMNVVGTTLMNIIYREKNNAEAL
ncbi:MAG TPA: M28 family peptidase [Bacteroidia bacterium]|jgi:glutaminyl-peptide cyclotransferase|nr:M28 family peptidase [Bacteroidia bacterium]